ncbi:hypothetical protein [Candidatus Marithrix sp. Canyon 246]|nr:hypothetical protein [Candidatus Marithrix sp. Canyon 246]
METLADFGVVSLFNYDTFTTAIYSAWGDFRSIEVATQLASILVLIAFFLIYFEKKARGGTKYYSSEMSNRQVYHATGLVGALISLFVFSVFMLSFAMPMLQLVIWAVDIFNEEWSDKYLSLIYSTVILTLGLFDRAAVPSLLMVVFGAILMLIFKWLDKKL